MKRFFLFFFFFLFLFSFIPLAESIRASPPSYDVLPFESGATHKFKMEVYNNGDYPYYVNLSWSGIASSVEFSDNMFLAPPGVWIPITIKVKLKTYDEISTFGVQRVNFKITEQADPRYNSGMFAVTTSVVTSAKFDVPIPGEYALIEEITIPNPEKGENTKIDLKLKNKGVLDLFDTTTKLSIVDQEGVLLDTLYFNNVDISAGETVEVSQALQTASYDSGLYRALGELTYSSEKIPSTKNKTFFVGGVDVLLIDYTKDLTKGKINKVKFELQSIFSQELKNVRASFKDYNDYEISLPVIDFTPYQASSVETFIDIPQTNDTMFKTELVLLIPVPGKGVETKKIPLEFNIIEPAPLVKEHTSFFSSKTNVYLVIIIFILMLIILLFIWSMNQDKKTHEEKKSKKTNKKVFQKKDSGDSHEKKTAKKDFDWSK
jgi:hypothetical protein